MFRELVFVSFLGLGLASSQRRFIFNTGGQQPQSPFGGGGGGGMTSPFGGSGGGMSSGSGSGYSPCTPSQSFCSLHCENGYVKGPLGCDFCLCNTNAHSVTTIGPVLVDPVDSKVSSTTSTKIPTTITTLASSSPAQSQTSGAQTTTSGDCVAARLKCSASCGDKGYLVDPSDCTFCLCKNSLV